jgi:cellulose synthase/poly-beta-1,6-N-acetylglucosamine synthase-like glycosyltransferase
VTELLLKIVFFGSAGGTIYVYAGYPLMLWALTGLGFGRSAQRSSIEPRVTLIVSAYNEAAVIAEKLRNCQALDYPSDKLEVLVVSDCSSDGTDDIVAAFGDPMVRLLRMPQRGGKTVGLNAAVAAASGEILVFSDANAMYDREAVRRLVSCFADPEVGAVTGESRYLIGDADHSTRSEDAYWQYELVVKRLESRLGSLVGGDGAIYAIRRSLYQVMAPGDLSDFVNPMQIVAQGFRNVYAGDAFSYERGADGFGAEFRRKVRIVNRAWRAAMRLKHLLNPLRYGFFALQFWSHKVLRWLVLPMLIAAFLANLGLVSESRFYQGCFLLQCLFYSAAAVGWLLQRLGGWQPRLLMIPYYFCAVNVASMLGIVEAFAGRTYTTWETPRVL